MQIYAKTPLRISLAGGGTDVTPYSDLHDSFIVNFTINLFVNGNLKEISLNKTSGPNKIVLNFNDNNVINNFNTNLSRYINKIYAPRLSSFINIFLESPVHPGSGLGASSAAVVTVIGLLETYVNGLTEPNNLAFQAFKCEREFMGISGGFQDQYSAVYGGLKSYSKKKKSDVSNVQNETIEIDENFRKEIEGSMVLVDLNLPRNGELIISDQQKIIAQGNQVALNSTQEQELIAKKIRKALIDKNVKQVGLLVDEAWQMKKNFSKLISNDKIESIIQRFKVENIYGAKLTGAGGGGHLLVIFPKENRSNILQTSKLLNLKFTEFQLTFQGFKSNIESI